MATCNRSLRWRFTYLAKIMYNFEFLTQKRTKFNTVLPLTTFFRRHFPNGAKVWKLFRNFQSFQYQVLGTFGTLPVQKIVCVHQKQIYDNCCHHILPGRSNWNPQKRKYIGYPRVPRFYWNSIRTWSTWATTCWRPSRKNRPRRSLKRTFYSWTSLRWRKCELFHDLRTRILDLSLSCKINNTDYVNNMNPKNYITLKPPDFWRPITP